MSAVFPPTPELPEPGYFSSSHLPRHYEFYGENKIMSLFQTYQRLESNKSRHSVPPLTKTPSTPKVSNRMCRLSDKVSLYRLLGFQFNDTGDKIPLHKKRGSFVYRTPADPRSFLEGILIQKQHFSPLMCKQVTWLSVPFTKLPEVSMYVIDLSGEKPKVIKMSPEATSMSPKGDSDSLKLWSCSRWLAHHIECPQFLKDSLGYLRSKCILPTVITVDVLGEMVIDVHAQSCVPDSVFNGTCYVEVAHQFDSDRPFYEESVQTVVIKD